MTTQNDDLQRMVQRANMGDATFECALWLGLTTQVPLHPAHEDDKGAALTDSRVVLSEPILNGDRVTGTLQIPTPDGKAWRPAVRDKQPVSVALYTHCIATAHIIARELPTA